MKGRILGLDVGTERIGIAVSDEDRLLARELTVVSVTSVKNAAYDIARLVRENDAQMVVIGLPVTMRGSEGEQARITRLFGAAIRELVDVPIEYIDERLTSKLSDAAMHELGLGRRQKKLRRDSLSAVFILQSFLDR